MQRKTKIIFVSLIISAYAFIPFASVGDAILIGAGYEETLPYVLVNLWEASIFVVGMLVGVNIMRRDTKVEKPLAKEIYPQ